MSPLPASLQLKPFAKSGAMKVQTNILEPTFINTKHARFVLERRAILASDSIFTFSLTTSTSVDQHTMEGFKPFLPVNTGIAALIKSCTLRLGNVVVSRTQDWNHYDTLAKSFQNPETRTLQGSVTSGRLDTLRPSPLTDGQMAMQNARYQANNAAEAPVQLDLTRIPVFTVKLSELFPALRGLQIPLGHMDDQMVVELEFVTQTFANRGVLVNLDENPPQAASAAYWSWQVFPASVTMVCDHLSFSDETHEEIDDLVHGGKGLTMPFSEIVTILGSIPPVPGNPPPGQLNTVSVTQELGLAGRTVKSIVVADTLISPIDDWASAPAAYRMNGQVFQGSTQVKVNDQNVFPQPITSVTHHITEIESAMGSPLYVSRAEYEVGACVKLDVNNVVFPIPQIDPNVSFCGKAMSTLQGQRHCEGVSLIADPVSRRGTKIRDKPIEYSRTIRRIFDEAGFAYNSRYYCEVEKAFQIKDGRVSVMV